MSLSKKIICYKFNLIPGRTDIPGHQKRNGIKMIRYEKIHENEVKASLTVEASLVLPVFLFFFAVFLYIIQIFILQETLQQAITDTGLGMARAAYIYSDFRNINEAKNFDMSFLENEIRENLQNILYAAVDGKLIEYAVKIRLKEDKINRSLIVGGIDGISFDDSVVLQNSNYIDIVARYRVRVPIRLFGLLEKDMIQRVRLRGWTGLRLPALYKVSDEDNEDNRNKIVYVTESGTVYHLDRNCSHIKLSVKKINGIPTWQRNNNGGKYKPCETCLNYDHPENGIYFITSFGDRYHIREDCSGIKRTVREVPLSEVVHMAPCKRCGGK